MESLRVAKGELPLEGWSGVEKAFWGVFLPFQREVIYGVEAKEDGTVDRAGLLDLPVSQLGAGRSWGKPFLRADCTPGMNQVQRIV